MALMNMETVDMSRFHYLIANAHTPLTFNKHQYDGVEWCVRNELYGVSCTNNIEKKIRGGLIADEMGLGKTLLMIGTMYTHFVRKTLIVLPPILIQQWKKEIYKITGHSALLYYGNRKKKIDKELDVDTFIANKNGDNGDKVCIVLTSYHTLCSKKSDAFRKIVWDRVIFDEAHHMRNKNTALFEKCFHIQAGIKWLVTGTPLQNTMKDLVHLCAIFGVDLRLRVPKTESKNAENGMQDNNSTEDDNKMLDFIKEHLILRRTKTEVGIRLPPIHTQQIDIPWENTKDKWLSQEIHSLLPFTNLPLGKYAPELDSYLEGNKLVTLLLARQTCISSSLIHEKLYRHFHLEPTIFQVEENVGVGASGGSQKLNAVISTLIMRKGNGKGKIVFCTFRKEIDFIAQKLKEGGIEQILTYDGRNSSGGGLNNILRSCDSKIEVLLLQIQTGCEGLNLQKDFSEIYFVSPNWNPSVEDQAIARCHRIGQEKVVDVFRFVMTGFGTGGAVVSAEEEGKGCTVEEYMMSVQEKKRQMIQTILQ